MKKNKRINLRLTDEQYLQLEKISYEMGLTKAGVLRKLIEKEKKENDK